VAVAASWLLMTSELPLISAVIARLEHQEVSLAAWGVVFSISTSLIQAPSTMLLAASTALSKDWDSYRQVRRFMLAIVVLLTTLHALIAFTPSTTWSSAIYWARPPKSSNRPGWG